MSKKKNEKKKTATKGGTGFISYFGSRKWSRVQLYADLAKYWAQDWSKAVRRYESNPLDFHAAVRFLETHPANTRELRVRGGVIHESFFWENLNIAVVKVDPKTKRIETKKNPNWKKNRKGKRPVDAARNTETNVWLEWGPWVEAEELAASWGDGATGDGASSHDWRVDTGGKTFEEAIVNLAHNIYVLYGARATCDTEEKLSKKDHW